MASFSIIKSQDFSQVSGEELAGVLQEFVTIGTWKSSGLLLWSSWRDGLHRYGPRGTCQMEQPLPVSADYASIQKLSVLSWQSVLTCA